MDTTGIIARHWDTWVRIVNNNPSMEAPFLSALMLFAFIILILIGLASIISFVGQFCAYSDGAIKAARRASGVFLLTLPWYFLAAMVPPPVLFATAAVGGFLGITAAVTPLLYRFVRDVWGPVLPRRAKSPPSEAELYLKESMDEVERICQKARGED